jgi:hypothetical protein
LRSEITRCDVIESRNIGLPAQKRTGEVGDETVCVEVDFLQKDLDEAV